MEPKELVSIGLGVAALFAVPMLSHALYDVLQKLAAKLNIDFNVAQEQQLRTLTDDAARVAEEWAEAKYRSTKNRPSGDEKLTVAVGHLQDFLPGLDTKAAINMIKGALPRLGLGAAVKVIGKIIAMMLLATAPLMAQSMPDRSADTATIVAQHADLFGTDDSRRPILYYVCAGLNVKDGGNWGLLEKPGGFVPSDIIVWRPTLEHVDVLTNSGPAWINDGRIQDAWRWIPAPAVDVPTAPADTPAVTGVEATLARIEQKQDQLLVGQQALSDRFEQIRRDLIAEAKKSVPLLLKILTLGTAKP